MVAARQSAALGLVWRPPRTPHFSYLPLEILPAVSAANRLHLKRLPTKSGKHACSRSGILKAVSGPAHEYPGEVDILTGASWETADSPASVWKISCRRRDARRLHQCSPPYSTCLKRAFVIFCQSAKPSRQEEIFVTT